MSILNKARRSDLIELCEECGINMPEKVTILSLIEAIKTWESFDEDFIKDCLEVISSASKEKKKLALEERKLELEAQAEKEKKQRKIETEKEKEQRKIEAEKEKEQRKIEAEKEKEEKIIALEERKLELEAEERREERRRQAEIEEKKLVLEIEDKEKMREFEIKKLTMQAEIDSQKDVEILAPRTGTGTALLQLVDVQREIQAQQLNILKAFYVDLLVPLETNIDKDTKVVACEQKRFVQQHKCLQESYLKAASTVKKQRKKNKGRASNLDKEIKNLQQLEEEKMKLDSFCERSLKQAITQERRRYGFVLERQCSLTKHNLVFHSQGQTLLQHHMEEWEEIAKSREVLPDPIDKLFPTANNYKGCSEYASANIMDHHPTSTSLYVPSPYQSNTLRKTRSIDTSCMDLREVSAEPFPRPLVRAKSDFNIASSNASLNSNDYGVTLRPKSFAEPDSKGHSRVRALYSYLSSGEHQLSFHEGDIITLIGDRNKGWQYGENTRNHRRGWFPIAYTAVLNDGPNVHPMDSSSLELKRRSVDLSNPYSSYFGVIRSRTTPNIQPYPSSTNSDETAESLASLPPPPPNAQRPLSTFIDTSNKNVDSLQRMRNNSQFLHPTTSLSIPVCPSPSATTPSSGPSLMSSDPLVRILPRRLPPLSTSLHSSNDSGFGNDAPPPSSGVSPTSPGFLPRDRSEDGKPKENIFSSVKLKKVITNDRSAPFIS